MAGNDVQWELKGPGWELDRVHFDRPPTTLTQSFYTDLVGESSVEGFAEWSLPVERYRFEVVNGWAYGRIDPFGGDPPGAVARFPFLANLWRIDPRARKRILGFDRFVREGGFERNIARWDDEWRPEAERRLAPLSAFDPRGASDAELADHVEALLGYSRWAWTFHLNIHVVCFYVRARFSDVCNDLLGLSRFEAYELMKRSDPTLLEGTTLLADVGRRAEGDPEVAAALELPAGEALEKLRGSWFQEELDRFLDAEGYRSGSYDLSDPTWREMPELVVGLVKGIIETDHDPVAEEREFQDWRKERIEELRGRLDGDRLEEFDRWLALAERAYPLNETHNGLVFERPMAMARYAALEGGRRLADAGRLSEVDEVFHLRAHELVSGLRGEDGDLGALAAERRREHERAMTLDPPQLIGGEPPDPPYHALPDAVGAALKAIIDQTEEMLGVPPQRARDDELSGSPGSPGSGEGPARVVRSLDEFDRVRPGDVLVCPLTGPAWTVLFPQVAALVTDSGGPLSHAAIVAREYGVPSVVGTVDGTRRLQDGQRVAVDGTTGVVRILAREPTDRIA
ncbi:MAG: PEP-utilizing enzyme [Actinomycetota bacterium]|nr:PEP-utilizing enzyme [Actinomycetota bacterium]